MAERKLGRGDSNAVFSPPSIHMAHAHRVAAAGSLLQTSGLSAVTLDGTYDNDLRSSLSPQSVNTLIFLNKNSDMKFVDCTIQTFL